jgi:hypothetical protein
MTVTVVPLVIESLLIARHPDVTQPIRVVTGAFVGERAHVSTPDARTSTVAHILIG